MIPLLPLPLYKVKKCPRCKRLYRKNHSECPHCAHLETDEDLQRLNEGLERRAAYHRQMGLGFLAMTALILMIAVLYALLI